MKIRVLNILFLLLFCTFSTFADIYTTPDGHLVEINLIPDKSEILINEPVYFSFQIKNLSTDDIGFVQGGDYRNEFGRPESFKVTAIGENGKLAKAVESRFNMGGMIGFSKIPAGESLVVRLLSAHWFNFEHPGKYSVRCGRQRQIIISKYDSSGVSEKLKLAGFPVEVAAAITVKADNYREMDSIIENIGKEIFSDNPEKALEAVKALTFIDDKRVIRHFDKLIENILLNEERPFYDVRFYAFRPLAKFVDQMALKAILKAINSSNNDVRREVSIALSKSLNPNAEKHLLSMRFDKFDAIRLDVVHFWGAKKTSASTAILKKMLKDESEMIRNEAKRYLEERGVKL